MRGTVQKKGNRWYAVVYDGLDEEGKQRRRWVPGGDRKKDAEKVLEQLIHRKYQGEPADVQGHPRRVPHRTVAADAEPM